MLTIVETPSFVTTADRLWSQEERLELFSHLAADPQAGEVIPGSGGCRKLRWSRPGSGKRGGTRVIYFLRTSAGEIWMLMAYAKTVQGNIPAHLLRQIRKEIEDG